VQAFKFEAEGADQVSFRRLRDKLVFKSSGIGVTKMRKVGNFTIKRFVSLSLISVLLSVCSGTNSVQQDQVNNKIAVTESPAPSNLNEAGGDYISYEVYKSQIEKYSSSRVILFFNASW
jgi:hypothetical protein